MGYPMAGHLARAGHDVTVFNRTAAKAEQWVAKHGGRSRDAGGRRRRAEMVLMCVGNDDDVARSPGARSPR